MQVQPSGIGPTGAALGAAALGCFGAAVVSLGVVAPGTGTTTDSTSAAGLGADLGTAGLGEDLGRGEGSDALGFGDDLGFGEDCPSPEDPSFESPSHEQCPQVFWQNLPSFIHEASHFPLSFCCLQVNSSLGALSSHLHSPRTALN